MGFSRNSRCFCWIHIILVLLPLFSSSVLGKSLISIKTVTFLGPQLTPDVEDVSRDGGYSVLVNGNVVWLYDDTECFDAAHNQLSFVSNTGAFGDRSNVSLVADFGVRNLGRDTNGEDKTAILPDSEVSTGGWIPFQKDELQFNANRKGQERVAICMLVSSPSFDFIETYRDIGPGTSPTSISTTQAFLFAPLVFVDYKPQDPSKEYQSRGMTLITIDAPASGPVAQRQGDLVIAGTEVPYGGFATLIGFKSTSKPPDSGGRDVYLFGMTTRGLQVARVSINDIRDFSKFTFFDPKLRSFSDKPPNNDLHDDSGIYLLGTFSSGNIFYSPYFATFVLIYFNKMVDSTFYIRYLDISKPLTTNDEIWMTGGKHGHGIAPEDVEAIVMYPWSAEEKLYTSPVAQGFNYAGMPHPEYFNRQHFAPTLYSPGTPNDRRINDWFGGSMIPESNSGSDGKNLLLSWTSQLKAGTDTGIYQVQLAIIEFDDMPNESAPSAAEGMKPTPTGKQGPHPKNTALNMIPKGATGTRFSAFVRFRSGHESDISAKLSTSCGMIGVSGFAVALIYWF